MWRSELRELKYARHPGFKTQRRFCNPFHHFSLAGSLHNACDPYKQKKPPVRNSDERPIA
jgi:hypothetical protein